MRIAPLVAAVVAVAPLVSCSSLSYRDLIAGAAPADAERLELTHELYQVFDGAHSHAQLTRVLHLLNPAVELHTVTEPDGHQRTDWAWLSDENLDAVNTCCRQFTGQARPHAELETLLAGLRYADEPQRYHVNGFAYATTPKVRVHPAA